MHSATDPHIHSKTCECMICLYLHWRRKVGARGARAPQLSKGGGRAPPKLLLSDVTKDRNTLIEQSNTLIEQSDIATGQLNTLL